MLIKTINKILTSKHNKFVDSIKDDVVKKLVKENSIITGGSIVSMLLNEEVNDFDYYFADANTCFKVAQYFVDQFNKRNNAEIKVTESENGRIKIMVRSSGIALDDGVEEDKDLFLPTCLSSNAITLSDKVQLVVRFYGDAEQIHTNYDFAHATCYWISKDNNLVLPALALEKIITKELYYTGSKYPLCSILRAKKFIKRGWSINAGQYVKMALQLNEIDLLDANVLEEQLTGVDSAYFNQAISVIKEKQETDANFKLDSQYLFEVINRIF